MSDSAQLGDGITVTVLGIQDGVVQLGFQAPEGTPIVLQEDAKPGDPNNMGLDGRD